jgi:hypothetical protein
VDTRLPAHLEVAGIRRLAESHGGFATVLAKGERDAGTIAIVIIGRDQPAWLCERMPQVDGNRIFVRTKSQDDEKETEFFEKVHRLSEFDPDLWLIEVDVADRERFVAELPR